MEDITMKEIVRREILENPEFTELKDYPISWIDRALSSICAREGLPLTAENKLRFTAMLESDLEHEFHRGDS